MDWRTIRIALGAALAVPVVVAAQESPPAPGQGVLRTVDGQPCVPVDGSVPAVVPRRKKKAAPRKEPPPPPMCVMPAPVIASGPSNEDLQKRLDEQQKEIDALKAAQKPYIPPVVSKMRFASFGEVNYANVQDRNPDTRTETVDLERFAVGFGYDFTPAIRLISMVEITNAATDDDNGDNGGDGPGDIHVEAAYVEIDLPWKNQLRTGVFPIPIGIINERHLPTDYYGVERPVVETEILPTTWSEGGLALNGLFGGSGLAYDIAVHGGLETPGISEPNAYRARNGMQRAASANAHGLASTGRLKYIAVPGLEIAGGLHYEEDLRQDEEPEKIDAWLYEAHVLGTVGKFSGRALWTQWQLNGEGPESRNRDVQDGYYLEGAWRFIPEFGVFAQWSEWDAGNNAGNAGQQRILFGFNYWPIPQVVFKGDFKFQDSDAGQDNDGFRLGVGWAF